MSKVTLSTEAKEIPDVTATINFNGISNAIRHIGEAIEKTFKGPLYILSGGIVLIGVILVCKFTVGGKNTPKSESSNEKKTNSS